MPKNLNEQMVEEWLRSHLSRRFFVSPARVDLSHELRHWGFLNEKDLAELVGSFNLACRSKDALSHIEVLPPSVLMQSPKTLGDLISAIADAIDAAAPAVEAEPILEAADLAVETLVPRLSPKQATALQWLCVTELPTFQTGDERAKPISASDTFGALNIGQNDATTVRNDFCKRYRVAKGKVDVNTVYNCMAANQRVQRLADYLAEFL